MSVQSLLLRVVKSVKKCDLLCCIHFQLVRRAEYVRLSLLTEASSSTPRSLSFFDTLLVTFVTLVMSSAAAQAEFIPRFDSRSFGVEVIGEYFSTDQNFDTFGNTAEMDGNTFEEFKVIPKVSYSLRPQWIIGAGAEVVYANSTNSAALSVNNFETSRTATELNNVSLYTHYLFERGNFRIIPTFKGIFTLQEVNPNTNSIITGEGTNQIEAGSWMLFGAGQFEPYVYVAYRYQDDDRASLLPWRLGSVFSFDRFYFRADIGGYFPVTDDKDRPNRIGRNLTIRRVNGGSLRYYSVNPSVIDTRLEAGIPVGKDFDIIAGGTYTLAGESTAYGYSIFVGFRFSAAPREFTSNSSAVESRMREDQQVEKEVRSEERRSNRALTNRKRDQQNRAAEDMQVETRPGNSSRSTTRRAAPRQQQEQFSPKLEDYDPKLFEEEMKKNR